MPIDTGDLIGLVFLLALAIGAWLGLKALAVGRSSTEEEFERRASDGPSMLTAGVNALTGILDPADAKGKAAVEESKQGRYIRKQREEDTRGNREDNSENYN